MRKRAEYSEGYVFPNKHWKIIREIEKRGKQRCFRCACMLCNMEYDVVLASLRKENGCFCCKSCAMSKDLVGQKFGRLLVLEKHSISKNRTNKYLCLCDCQNTCVVFSTDLRSKKIISCGCYRNELLIHNNKLNCGELAPNWKGGVTPQNKIDRDKITQQLNPLVRERDGETCQKCSQHKGWLEVHHIFDFGTYQELRFEINNLITLCKNCHDDFHSVYSRYGSNTLSDLEAWLSHDYKYRTELLAAYSTVIAAPTLSDSVS
jgi:hypothetical protein